MFHSNVRSCIFCTNVAESGATIPNVDLVISPGVHRRFSVDVRTGVMVNVLQTLSKSQTTQQKGRPGRTDEGEHGTMMSYGQYTTQVPGMSQPGWEDLGWENASYCPLYQVILFDWMACLNNACNHCRLQLEEIMLASGCHDKYVRPRSFSTANITRGGKILPQWSVAVV